MGSSWPAARVCWPRLAILPGRAGVAAGVLAVYLVAALLAALGMVGAGKAVLGVGLILHAVLLVVLVAVLRGLPPNSAASPRRGI